MRNDLEFRAKPGAKIIVSDHWAPRVLVQVLAKNRDDQDLRVWFDSLEQAEQFADAIFHIKMDRDATEMQADEAATH